MPSSETVEACISQWTQLDKLASIETIEPCPLDDVNIPFLGKDLIGQRGIKVTLGKMRLKLSGQAPGFKDPRERHFTVLLDASAKRVVAITSKCDGKDPNMRPEVPRDLGQIQLSDHGETYDSFVEQAPKLSFLEALGFVITKGGGSPFDAKEIDGYCVTYSRRVISRPTWIVILRGITPLRRLNDGTDWKRTHMRVGVDDNTGELVLANSLPGPLQ